MKILHLGNVPVPRESPQYARVAGRQHPGRWVLNTALAQRAAGADVEVFTQAHRATCDFECDMEGVPVRFLRTYHPYRHLTFYALDSVRMARAVRRAAPDIVHAHGTEAAYGWAAQRAGLPHCITAQGLFFQILPTLGRRPTWNERFLRWGEHLVLRRERFVIAKSEYVRDALAAKYPNLELTLIPNTYEPSLDGPLAARSGHEIAFVGTVCDRKGVHILADAMRMVSEKVPDVVLHMVGNPREKTASGYAGEQLRRLRALLGNRLVLHGKIPSQALFAVLDRCVALAAPSTEEMFGNQLIEALMRGCHGVVTEATAMAENVRRFGNGTVVPQRDPAALAAALAEHLLFPPTDAEREAARRRIRDWMSPGTVAALHLDFYERILSAQPLSRKTP